MTNETIPTERLQRDFAITQRFLDSPGDDSFADLFRAFTPQLVSFFRSRGCDLALAEDLAQDVMLMVYRKSAQLRDREAFRYWLFTIARNTLRSYYDRQRREVETVDLTDITDRSLAASERPAATPAFEFLHWMAFLDSRERDVMRLRFIEDWEYHEIAAARSIPIGTVQWRVFNAKKKLAPHLAVRPNINRKAA
jgi:RNA polymerase sigma-70 factor, ECF subfamily